MSYLLAFPGLTRGSVLAAPEHLLMRPACWEAGLELAGKQGHLWIGTDLPPGYKKQGDGEQGAGNSADLLRALGLSLSVHLPDIVPMSLERKPSRYSYPRKPRPRDAADSLA